MIGRQLAHYTITELLGTGGMGEVYRARDEKLGRDVALKILPQDYTSDAQRMGRFQREARLLASLNHPNIGGIHGVEEADGVHALVLELIEGADLAQLLQARPLGVDEALKIAVQVAEALEAAHENGVVHRDLKPANIKINPDGAVKVLDFGLAKALAEEVDSDPNLSPSMSPTLSIAATSAGLILGTAAYMSPEQSRGRAADRRADVWAFGVVLYEMLARRQMFSGETVSDTLAAIIKDEPDWSLLPTDAPPLVGELIRRCVVKDPRQRLQSIGEARIALENLIRGESSGVSVSFASAAPIPSELQLDDGDPVRASRSISSAWWIALLVLVAAVAGFGGYRLRGGEPAPERARRFVVAPDGLEATYPSQPSLSPNGRYIAYFADHSLYIRDLHEITARSIPRTQAATSPFWSPDSEWLAYGQAGRIWKVPAAGGPPVSVCDVRFGALDGGAWGEDGMLYLAPNSGPIYRVSSRGGDPEVLFEPGLDESDFHTPSVLPGDGGLIYTIHNGEGRSQVERYTDGERVPIFDIPGARVEYTHWSPDAPGSTTGHLIYHRLSSNPGIWALPYSLDRLEPTGEAFILDPDGVFPSTGRGGSLLYVLGAGGAERQLVLVNREGQIVRSIEQPQLGMRWPELSPDERYVLVSAVENENVDIWIHDLERLTKTRFTFGPEVDWRAIWANGGRDVIYTNGSAQTNRNFIQSADASTAAHELVEGYDISLGPDGKRFAFNRFHAGTGADILVAEFDDPDNATILLGTEEQETAPMISPNGDLMVYMSSESGANEVYMTRFPDGTGKWQVSSNGGVWPVWSRDGSEIFYRQSVGANAMFYSVRVSREPPLELSTPVALFGAREAPSLEWGSGFRGYETTADPDVFLMLERRGDLRDQTPRLVYCEHWRLSHAQQLN